MSLDRKNQSIYRVSVSLMIVISIVLSSFASIVNAAEVESVSREFFRKQSDERFWEASVTCVGNPKTILLLKDFSSQRWCSSVTPDECNTDKAELAKQVCRSAELSTQLSEPSKKASRSDLVKEKMQIDQELLQIHERELQLRREELKLQKQSLDLGDTNLRP